MEFKDRLSPIVQPSLPAHVLDTSDAVQPIVPTVRICHPGYPEGSSPLLLFRAVDDGGVDYNVVYIACCILVGNAWPRDEYDDVLSPYLAESSSKTAPAVSCPIDGILRRREYYFFVPGFPEDEYPITPNFFHWVFPHRNLPTIWRDFEIRPVPAWKRPVLGRVPRDAIITRDECCRVTQSYCGTQHSHVVPVSVTPWFTMNNMFRYAWGGEDENPRPIDDISNGMLLRSDVHHMIDKSELVMFPKFTGEKYEIVLHLLHSRSRYAFEQEAWFHNRKCQDIYGVSRECMFAAFAWSIFQECTLRFFLAERDSFQIRVRESNAPGSPPNIVFKTAGSISEVRELAPPFGRMKKRSRGGTDEDCRWIYSVRKGEMVCLTDEEEGSEEHYDESDTDTDEKGFRSRKLPRISSLDGFVPPTLSSSNSSSNDSNASSEHLGSKFVAKPSDTYYTASKKPRFFDVQYRC
ncbi:hypothetical protein F4781DRAFT_434343 [Annulohypoxylon bovei var. microspora]|nr:hypothetical protein F4781DRAFT_434343 [Annulohypoxylon bovei var. microspora]